MTTRRMLRSGILATAAIGAFSLGSAHLTRPAAPPATIAYHDAPLSVVLDDLDRATGVRVVAFPDVAVQRVSGRLVTRNGGLAAARAIATALGYTLRRAGPHWALVRTAG